MKLILQVKITGNNGKKSTKEKDNATPGPSPKQTKKPLSPEEMRKRRGEASALLKEQFDGEPSQVCPFVTTLYQECHDIFFAFSLHHLKEDWMSMRGHVPG